MWMTLSARRHQGYRTIKFPGAEPELPAHFQGRPRIDREKCCAACGSACVAICPVGAISERPVVDHPEKTNLGADSAGKPLLQLDLGRCLFCGQCAQVCPSGAIEFTRNYRLGVGRKEDLQICEGAYSLAQPLDLPVRRILGRSLRLRQVSAGGCNACESDINVLGTVVFDWGRFGIQIVASPRHADGLLVTGPVSGNMREALLKTWEATPPPRLVIAVGACAISGGPFAGHPEVGDGVADLLPVDLFLPGCPPHPITILDGVLRLLGKIPNLNSKTEL